MRINRRTYRRARLIARTALHWLSSPIRAATALMILF